VIGLDNRANDGGTIPHRGTDNDRLPSSTGPDAAKARLIFRMCVTMIVFVSLRRCVTRSRSQSA
jgi:hypothetical protein